MSKFNKTATRPAIGQGPLATDASLPTTTYEGGDALHMDIRTELYTLAVTNMVGESTFYEGADDRDDRFSYLVRSLATRTSEGFEWLSQMLAWLRTSANMRSASLVGAAEAVHARLGTNWGGVSFAGGNRTLISSVLQRADEPGEFLAYWTSRFGRTLPAPVKRGVGDAALRLYDEYAYSKWDGKKAAFSFADVLRLTHPKPTASEEITHELFGHITHPQAKFTPGDGLAMLQARAVLMGVPKQGRKQIVLNDPVRLKLAGMTWESTAGWLGESLDADTWAALLPSMGYMALLRNLNNFDRAGLSPVDRRLVAQRLADPEQVAKSKQFPYRFLTAYLAAESDNYKVALAEACDLAVKNIPALTGRTLVLVDTSGSMTQTGISERSKAMPVHIAGLFGASLAVRNPGAVDVAVFATNSQPFAVKPHAGILNTANLLYHQIGSVGHGTNVGMAVAEQFNPAHHSRVILLTDMQTVGRGYFDHLPGAVSIYAFDLAGYGKSVVDTSTPNRVQLAGFTDQMFSMIPLLERGKNVGWPWEVAEEMAEEVDKG
jgi:hypothetical protein